MNWNQDSLFTREMTNALKGIALVLMFFHHFFTIPETVINGDYDLPLIDFFRALQNPAKICVPVFAFLTGYFYFFSKAKNLRYSARKISDFLIHYWAVYLPLFALALLTGFLKFKASAFLRGLFGMDGSVMIFCWYVYFYCTSLLLLPLLTKNEESLPLLDVFLLFVLPNWITSIISEVLPHPYLQMILSQFRFWFPAMASGYLFAKYRLFDVINDYIQKLCGNKTIPEYVIYGFFILFAMAGRNLAESVYLGKWTINTVWIDIGLSMDILYAPLFILGAAAFLQLLNAENPIRKVLAAIGKKSMHMWFIHCIFFDCFQTVTQKILYWPQNPVLVLVWGLAICYCLAILTNGLGQWGVKMKNRCLGR